METWFIIIATLCTAALLRSIFALFHTSKERLPPGPLRLPLIGNLIWLRRPFGDLDRIVRSLTPRYGPLITLKIVSQPIIMVSSRSLAHAALVRNGAVFADRAGPMTITKLQNRPQKAITTSSYGPTWRRLRRNLTHVMLHPSRIRGHAASRRWVLSLLTRRLSESEESSLRIIDHIQFGMFSQAALMCFGDKLDEDKIKGIQAVLYAIVMSFRRYDVINFWPRLGRIIFHNRWREVIQMRENQDNVLLPLIRGRIQAKQERKSTKNEEENVVVYVDTLSELQLPEENHRKLHEDEIQSLCTEFLLASTEGTSTTLQWMLANMVKYPQIQNKLYQEIISVAGPPPQADGEEIERVIAEEDLQKLPYLKAVVLETLRRHPPGKLAVPHKMAEDVELDGYTIPKDALVNFMLADLALDPEVWEDPMEFKPERFMQGMAFDLTGNRGIKMMPFGAGRRICPGLALAMLHLEFFLANLVWLFEWRAVEGDEVDLTEKQELAVTMKKPLRACISPRS